MDEHVVANPLALARLTLEQMHYWSGVMSRAQQLILEDVSAQAGKNFASPDLSRLTDPARVSFGFNIDALAETQADFWSSSLMFWQRILDPVRTDPRQAAAIPWRYHPIFDLIREIYGIISLHLMRTIDTIEGVDDKQREKMRFAVRSFTEAMSPSNFALTNPAALERMLETRGESLLKGLQHLLRDLSRGQLTQSPAGAFTVGEDIAATPGKVIHETPLFQLIQYAPTTEAVLAVPLVIFPPWINRYYILDLGAEKSFVRWAVEQGLTVFMVSWRSADQSFAGITLDDYVAAQIEAIDVARDVCSIEAVHTIGYCVAGTTLAATLALLVARSQGGKVKSATFFTAQVDFSEAGDLSLFVDDVQLDLVAALSSDQGYLDGRYMAAAFNLLRGRDLIWNYVVNNYLMGEDHRPFDLLHWNADTTNLPAAWLRAYLRDFYHDNLLVCPGALCVLGTPIDINRVTTPSYVQAGQEDHIAPPQSVWKITEHFRGPVRFVLAGSGHIAGVVNPPAVNKYRYWSSEEPAGTFDEFVAAAVETPGSWWPDWFRWIEAQDSAKLLAKGARLPGKGKRKALEDAPGRYVKIP
ncbi:PHA/PHB synthase family protein [Sphingobium phenoxybenzoativorans]|uniref:PHA/PHB synthase family protein n=1 Tax=Sphingobium phenoxybenzoativorans TaxID=1592790 RepID=UPI000871D62B|nr:alpha/beta fold hydrolase [Sphingobium phenoxybenzoativorans]